MSQETFEQTLLEYFDDGVHGLHATRRDVCANFINDRLLFDTIRACVRRADPTSSALPITLPTGLMDALGARFGDKTSRRSLQRSEWVHC